MTQSGAQRRGRWLLLVLGLGLALGVAPASVGAAGPKVPRFVEETATAGIDHVNSYAFTPESPDGGWEFVVGGGMAVLDCDQDGLPDLYLAGGSSPSQLYRNASEIGGALRFDRLPDPTTDLVKVSGAYPLDVDADGHVDLAVLRLGENVMLRGVGDCHFERANEAWGIDGGQAWTTAFSAAWKGRSSLPTLAFGNYLAIDEDGYLTAGCSANELFEPASETGYGAPTSLEPGWCALSMLFSDWDRSGQADLRISNDRQYYVTAGEEQLWRIRDGEAPRLYDREDGWAQVQIYGMGIASQDLTGDGRPEVFLTSIGDNRLLTLETDQSRPAYRDIAAPLGVIASRPHAGGDKRPSTAWHPAFEDLNNDGLTDLFITKGNVDEQPDYALKDPSDLLLGRPDGTFVQRARQARLLTYAGGRGGAVTDLNMDGLLDVVQVNSGKPVQIWRNLGRGTARKPKPMGGWLGIRLEQAGGNRDAVGASIEVKADDRTVAREVTVGGGHASGIASWIHFGLGSAANAEVRVQWPDGELGPWLPVMPNRFLVVKRGAQEPVEWLPTRDP